MFYEQLLQNFKRKNEPLKKATNMELFYDLVFIFCLRKITPVVVAACEAGTVSFYTYYTFCFAFVLMMQIWFYSTILMNHFGNGGYADRACLLINMFLLFLMSNAISEDWENYLTYNICWILILINYCCHWYYRLKKFTNLTKYDRETINWTILIMGIQAALVMIANFLPSFPAQVLCAIAVLNGFTTWFVNNRTEKARTNFHHLSERCMLIIIIIFGETIVSLGEIVSNESNLRIAFMMFAVFIVLLLIYLQEVDKNLDMNTKANGTGYMVITVWLGFCVFNMTLALELIADNLPFLIDPQMYLGICICLYMMSFLFFIPYNEKSPHRNIAGFLCRIIACACIIFAFSIRTQHSLIGIIVAFGFAVGVLMHDRYVHKETPSNLGVG